MPEVKFIEIRDKGTFIPAIALRVSGAEHYLMRRAGWGYEQPGTYLFPASLTAGHLGGVQYDSFKWGDRTYQIAHRYLEENWERVWSGAVVDVEFILGETKVPKVSESESETVPEW